MKYQWEELFKINRGNNFSVPNWNIIMQKLRKIAQKENSEMKSDTYNFII